MQWKKVADQEFSSLTDILSYQKKVQENEEWKKKEQMWVDNYLQPLIDLMGESKIWKSTVGPDVELYGVDKNDPKRSRRNIPMSENPQAYFGRVDSVGHWYSRKPNHKEWFDPYTTYQFIGTNQFCQTFALMNLIDALPNIVEKTSQLSSYYVYTKQALYFIKHVIEKSLRAQQKKMYLKKVRECLRHSNICFNAIHIKKDPSITVK